MEHKVVDINIVPDHVFLHSVQTISEAVMAMAGTGAMKTDYKTYNLVLAVDEIVSNIYRHGLKNSKGDFLINLKYFINDDKVRVEIREGAPEYTPPTTYDEKMVLEKYCGIGLHLVRTLMDEYKYYFEKESKTNVVMISLNI
ncbi:MAG: ATP-binding protein [Spirochaetes bacterium]|nr:ATP-binding protein [Spirochaetota bacterium]